ncbi:MAG: hypothetical protein LOY04_08440, partial [Rhodococcus ruber]|nr:hypothetical protein [Rhodococcus ruber]
MVGDAGAAHARWRQIVEDIGRFDAGAGRQAQCALERHDAPLRVQIAGRGGAVRPTLRTAVESAVATVAHVEAAHVEAARVEAAELDSPDRPEPAIAEHGQKRHRLVDRTPDHQQVQRVVSREVRGDEIVVLH